MAPEALAVEGVGTGGDKPAPGGMVIGAWLVFAGLAVVLPLAVFWLCSHFIMEDDRFRYSLIFYFIAAILVVVATVALMWVSDFAADDIWLAGTVYGVVMVLTLLAYFGAASKVWYAGSYQSLVFGLLTLGILIGATIGTMFAIRELPVGKVFAEKVGGPLMLNDGAAAWANAGTSLYTMLGPAAETINPAEVAAKEEEEAQAAPFASAEMDIPVDKPEPEVKPMVAKEEPPPLASQEPPAETATPDPAADSPDAGAPDTEATAATDAEEPPAEPEPVVPSFQIGDTVTLTREVVIPTDYGEFKLKPGDTVEIVEQLEGDRWKVKRGMLNFEVASADVQALL